METDPEEEQPAAYIIIHHRAYGPTCYFGPFFTVQEAFDWQVAVGNDEHIVPGLVAVYKTVDWNR